MSRIDTEILLWSAFPPPWLRGGGRKRKDVAVIKGYSATLLLESKISLHLKHPVNTHSLEIERQCPGLRGIHLIANFFWVHLTKWQKPSGIFHEFGSPLADSAVFLLGGKGVMWEQQEQLMEKNYHFIFITLASLSAIGIDSLMH